jgi:hypothetical protein
MTEQLSWQKQLAVDVIEKAIKTTNECGDFLDSKSVWIGTSSAAVMSFVAALNLFPKTIQELSLIEISAAIAFVVCSSIVAVFCAMVWWPVNFVAMGSSDPKDMREVYLEQDADEAYRWHLDGLCHVYNENWKRVQRKGVLVSWMLVFFAAQITFLGIGLIAGLFV